MLNGLRRPAVLLRYGRARDSRLINEVTQRGWLDGLVVPGNILAYQAVATPHYVRSFDLPYVIDPMSYVFARKDWFMPANEMRPSIRKLLESHGKALHAVCEGEARALQPDDLTSTFLDDLAAGAIDFQTSAVSQTPSAHIERYFKFLKRTPPSPKGRAPEAVVAPYFFVDAGDSGPSWLDANLQVVSAVAQAGNPVAAVLFYDTRLCVPSPRPLWRRVITGYQQCEAETIFLWADNLEDDFEDPGPGRGLAEATKALASSGKRVLALYGGYFSLLLHRKGMAGISHGMLYTQHKAAEAAGSPAGPPPVRYYFPDFHQFRSIAQAVRIVDSASIGVPCDCTICRAIFQGDPGRIVEFEDVTCATRHFMAARRSEADLVARTDLKDLLRQLEQAYNRWHRVVAGLPNPDSDFGALMRGLQHLRAWVAALTD